MEDSEIMAVIRCGMYGTEVNRLLMDYILPKSINPVKTEPTSTISEMTEDYERESGLYWSE